MLLPTKYLCQFYILVSLFGILTLVSGSACAYANPQAFDQTRDFDQKWASQRVSDWEAQGDLRAAATIKPQPAARLVPRHLTRTWVPAANLRTSNDDDANSPSTPKLTLQELKRVGALASSYRNSTQRPAPNETPTPKLDLFRSSVQPILQRVCIDCHGPDTQEGNIRIDSLDPDLLNGNDTDWWLEVLAVVSNGEMPPAGETELPDEDRTSIIEWLSIEIQNASTVRRSRQGHSSFRRMTGYEYNYALQDLLGLRHDFASDLPPESTSEDGFQNSSENLSMTSTRLDYYPELARSALQNATVQGNAPSPLYWHISLAKPAIQQWELQEGQLTELKKQQHDTPEVLAAALQQLAAQFKTRHPVTHYKQLETGQTAPVAWSYPEAQFAWKPVTNALEPPAISDHVVIIPTRQKFVIELGDKIPDKGTLRIRIRAARTSTDTKRIPSLQLEFGWQASNDSQAAVRISPQDIQIDAIPGQPKFYQWDIPLSQVHPRNSVRNISQMGDLPSPSEFLRLVNSSQTQGDILIDFVEITAPFYAQWPPQSHRDIFFDSDNRSNETTYAKKVLQAFMRRAWRRNVTQTELEQKLELLGKVRPHCDTFQEAMVEVLAAVLSSPQFLYLNGFHQVATSAQSIDDPSSNPSIGNSTDFELATRLSMFLWCSTPDNQLLTLASQGQLRNADVLNQQVDRMLADPRSQRFSRHFVRQWLGMQLLDYLKVDQEVYPQFDEALKEALQEEPIAFFHQVLQHNHNVLDFIHADYTMANERLAGHYGLKNVWGNHFRKVTLTPQEIRGGLLTQAGLLAMNSDGKDSHPLKRGIWLLKCLLNDPPPPPPPAVPIIDLADPEIAKLTLKQRIENHRNDVACMSCHAKIDPWGIAFENFDAVGAWRTQVQGQPIDATSLLFNKQELDGIDGLKRFLLENRQDQFVRSLVHKLSTYALGRPLTFGDLSSVDQITADLRNQDDGLATMIKLIVTSELFGS